jgi:hypothetical protein
VAATNNLETISSINTPESEHERITNLHPESLDKSVQTDLQEKVLSPEVMQNCRKLWSGINVLGGGPNPMLLAGKETSLEMAKQNDPALIEVLKAKGMEQYSQEEAIDILCNEEDIQEQRIRSVELETIERIGAKRIRLHFDETLTHLSTIEGLFDDDGNIKESEKNSDLYSQFVQFTEYINNLEKHGTKVEITLGPGVRHPERTSEKRYMYSVTEYELPSEEDDKKVWEKYCKGIARNFPNADLTVWIEPNFDAFVKGGRDPVKYAEAVCTAANAARDVDPTKKVGINMLFLDQSFAMETLQQIEQRGYSPKDLVGYITFNPYRFQAPEAPTWTEGARNRIFRDQPMDELALIEYETYEDEVKAFYKHLSKYEINDIRVGESGYESDGYSPHQNAVCNIHSWVLDKYLWVRETPWRAIQKEGSKSNRGLVSEDGVTTENFFAYKHFNEIFTPDVIPVGELTDPADRRVYCKIFRNTSTNEDIAVLWTAQTYNPSEDIYSRTVILDVPEISTFKQISGLCQETVEEQNITGALLKEKGVKIADDPIILVGNFGFDKSA